MGDVITASGTKFFIGPTATSATDTAGEFAALTPWVEVGLVENLGDYGDEASQVNFSALGDARVRASKGARDAGMIPIIVGDDPTDAGQLAMIAAEGTNLNYAFKVVTPNRLNLTGTDQIEYFRALVMSKRKSVGTNDNIIRRTFNMKINSPIVDVAPTAGV